MQCSLHFQRISVIFCLPVPDVLKIAFSTMDLLYNRIVLYNRIILYNRTISSLVLFIFTGVIFGVFDIIYFRLALKALDIGRFSWWMCCKNEIRTKFLSLKSSNFSKFYPNPLKWRVSSNSWLLFFAWHRKDNKFIFSGS